MKYGKHKVNVRTIRNLKNNEGLTLKNGYIVTYKTGWQVAYSGIECYTPEEAMQAIRDYTKALPKGVCVGVWLSEGIYYIDFSLHITSKQVAMEMGERFNQQSIYCWYNRKRGQLEWLGE